jgi:hypothetical protein
MPRRESNGCPAVDRVEGVRHHDQPTAWLARQRIDGTLDLGIVMNLDRKRLLHCK